jgi:hypothetical protein
MTRRWIQHECHGLVATLERGTECPACRTTVSLLTKEDVARILEESRANRKEYRKRLDSMRPRYRDNVVFR